MKRTAFLASLFLLAVGCGEPSSAEPAPGVVNYHESGGKFSCQVPADWRVDERASPGHHVVTFFGPAQGSSPFSIALTVAYRDDVSAQDFYILELASGAQSVSPLSEGQWKGRKTLSFTARRVLSSPHGPPVHLREKTLLIPLDHAFLEVTVSAPPVESYAADSVLAACLETLSVTAAH